MDSKDFVLVVVSAVGFISICYKILAFITWLYKMFIRPPKDLRAYGSWAVITGSTDGIGKALAFELASRGLNLVCIGRNPTKLESTATEVHNKLGPGIAVQNITLDFDKSGPDEILSAVDCGTRGLDVGLLVNNVGMAYDFPRFFHETEDELIDAMIRVNVKSAVWVTKAVIPGMITRKKGAILNIGSGSSVSIPSFPLYALYAASKAFVATFSKCIAQEYKDYGIDVQCQTPDFISTKMTEIITNDYNVFVPSVDTYVRSSVRWMGYDKLCSPFWWHSVQSYIIRSLPDSLVNWCVFEIFLRLRSKRRRDAE